MPLVSRLLATTALLSVLASTAIGAENFANVDQSGASNSGLVTQTGVSNDVGTSAIAARQVGNQNILIVTQTGDDNSVGTLGNGFAQSSNRNTATITQTADDNVVGQVTQAGIGASTGGSALRRNILAIVQDSTGESAGNRIASVSQTRSSAPLASTQPANAATLTQTGGSNLVGSAVGTAAGVVQSGYGQSATITQTGNGNVVTSTAQVGSRNRLQVSFTGNDNGTVALATLGAPAGAWGSLVQGRIRQSNDFLGAGLLTANDLVFNVIGDRNSFGFDQEGSENTISGTVDGDGNQTGSIQLGAINDASFTVDGDDNKLFIQQGLWAINVGNTATATLTGDDNIVALRQSGGANEGTVTLTGNANKIHLTQDSLLLGNTATIAISGDLNDAVLTQSGSNEADINIIGDSNLLLSSQTGLNNELSIKIYGSNSNQGAFTAGGPARLAAGSLLPGSVSQNGSGNSIIYGIGIAGDPSNDRNLFAFSQTGSGNRIEGTTVGDSNEAAVIQSGNNNFTSFNQIGSGNIIGVMQ